MCNKLLSHLKHTGMHISFEESRVPNCLNAHMYDVGYGSCLLQCTGMNSPKLAEWKYVHRTQWEEILGTWDLETLACVPELFKVSIWEHVRTYVVRWMLRVHRCLLHLSLNTYVRTYLFKKHCTCINCICPTLQYCTVGEDNVQHNMLYSINVTCLHTYRMLKWWWRMWASWTATRDSPTARSKHAGSRGM